MEFRSLETQVRNLIQSNHWQTDGEWKESIVRRVLRERLPRTLEVCRGFIVTNDAASSQIDVLVVDTSRPVFFRDGDLVIVGADAVVAAIEVKTDVRSWSPAQWRQELGKSKAIAEMVPAPSTRNLAHPQPFIGLFAFHGGRESCRKAAEVAAAIDTGAEARITHIAAGSWHFARLEREATGERPTQWSSYQLPDRAFGYFINGLLEWVAPSHVEGHLNLYFPKSGKSGPETRRFPIASQ